MQEDEDKIRRLLEAIKNAIEGFNRSLSVIQSDILARVELISKDLDLRGQNIKTTVRNLEKINQLKAEVEKAVISKEYKKRVIEFGKAFNTVTNIQEQYFSVLINKFEAPKVLKEIKDLSIERTVQQLTESGIRANISEKLGDIIRRNTEEGAKYTDLVKEVREFMIGDKDTPGKLVSYAEQITTDGLNQYVATYDKIITDDLGLEWFWYVGALVEQSRELCRRLVAKKFIHKSEIPTIVKGIVDGVQVPIYKKTGLPYGMIAGTNANNFQVRRGGHKCNHLMKPTSKERVPKSIREQHEASGKVSDTVTAT